MKKVFLILFIALLILSGCNQDVPSYSTVASEDANENGLSGSISGEVEESKFSLSNGTERESVTKKDKSFNTMDETSKSINGTCPVTMAQTGYGNSSDFANKNNSAQISYNVGEIKLLDFDKQCTLSGGKQTCLLEINTFVPSDKSQIIDFTINGKPNHIQHNYEKLETALYYVDMNGQYHIIIDGEIGNDYYLIETFLLSGTNVKKENEIPGKIIKYENGEIKVESRQFLVGFEVLTAIYKISEAGQLTLDGNYEISSDGANNGFCKFTLVKDIGVNIYDSVSRSYKETTLQAGEGITFYQTDMINKLYFMRDNGDKGYIAMEYTKDYPYFFVNGEYLVEYFDKNELSWAG